MEMFCFQCEQTARGSACDRAGVCGKGAATAGLQDDLVAASVSLACAAAGKNDRDAERLIADALFVTMTNVNFDDAAIRNWISRVDEARARLGAGERRPMSETWSADEDIRSLRSLILFGLKGMAAYAHHARVLGHEDAKVDACFADALAKMTSSDANDLLETALEVGRVNLACMELLDRANVGAYGKPEPTKVTMKVEPQPFIVISGHDLRDLQLLLEQTEGRGVNVYTHGEMLPAHAYPELKKFKHLKGHFGTAWQSQQKELDGLPAPILFTTNCIMPPLDSYRDRVFTTSVVGYPGVAHIDEVDGKKDFSPIIDRAIALGGFKEAKSFTGINGGSELTVGFAHDTVMGVADKVISAIKSGAIKHIFLVGGCDGAKAGRDHYTEFVKRTPKDTIVLTLACGKFRFNDLDLGDIGGIPRLLDMGQCNDAYSAIQVAVALAKAFDCGVNDLPLTLVLSWYEQKAAAILLTLLALDIKDIYLGPSLPAFLSPNILKAVVDRWNVTPISTPEEDLKKILKR